MILQGPRKDFALHTIGWQAFQDMANTIVEVAFGRTVVRLAKSQDEGRDGFFRGLPDVALKTNDRRETTIQTKHFEAADRRLKASDVTSELRKVATLAASGRAHGYILVTKASVAEGERRKFTDALRAHGVVAPYVLGREWLVEKILAHVEVRALLPRVYGLGDMSWIQNETALKQARAILTSKGSGLKLYVPTAAHLKAAHMLAKHGCVLLLGDPAAGKSAIAAALCIAEVDRRNGDVIYVRDPKDFIETWDPDAADRLFWIDDAFGATRLATGSMDVWNKIFSSMASAREHGNRFVLTSRSHIWNEAQSWLKRTAYEPLLQEKIVVQVENLSLGEKERILYNHIRFGRQPPQFKRKIAPLLDRVLASGHFSPEVARRLGDPSFTSRVLPTVDGLVDFFAHPSEFLGETLANLPEAQLGAIGLVFLNDGKLRSPLEQDECLRLVADLYGVTLAQLRCALRDLDGSFLTCIEEGTERAWTYKHPTMADAYRRLVGPDPELVAIYVRGAPVARIFEEATCGVLLDGTIPIPSALYDRILDRLPGCGVSDDVVRRFLLLQSGDDFFARFLRRWPEMVTRRSRVYVPAAHCDHTLVRVRAAQLGCLPDEGRSTLIDDLQRVLREHADVSFIGESAFDAVLTAGERALMLDEARRDPTSRFDRAFAKQPSLFPSHFHTWACYEDLEDQLRRHRTLFPDEQAIQDAAGRMLERIEKMLNEDALANSASRRFIEDAHPDELERPGARRSIFDDLS